jgi:hypothetical protein
MLKGGTLKAPVAFKKLRRPPYFHYPKKAATASAVSWTNPVLQLRYPGGCHSTVFKTRSLRASAESRAAWQADIGTFFELLHRPDTTAHMRTLSQAVTAAEDAGRK